MTLLVAVAACGGDGEERRLAVAPGDSTIGATHTDTPAAAAAAGQPAPASSSSVPPTSRPEARRETAETQRAATATSAPAGAQTTTSAPASQLATIHGVVSRGGEPAPGARLTLVGGNGSERVTAADGSGGYRFTDVPAGSYELITYAESGKTCDANGCISASWSQRDELTVAAGETLRFDVNGA